MKTRSHGYQYYILPTALAMKSIGGGGTKSDILKQLSSMIEYDTLENLKYKLGWALTYLKKFDIASNMKRGFWKLNTKIISSSDDDIAALIRGKKNDYTHR